MIHRALAALALGGTLFIILPGFFQTLDARQSSTVPPELIERYRQTLSSDQSNLTLHYLLGVALLQDQQNAKALAELQAAYPAYQESIEAHYNLAIATLRLNDPVSTEIYLQQAEALGAIDMPDLYPVADLYFNLAIKSQETGDANEAIRYFHKVLSLTPQRYEVYRQLGDLHAQRDDTDLAIKSFRKYLEQFPDDPLSRDYLFALEFNRGQDLLAANDLTNAKNGFSASLEIQPDSPAALYYLGYIAYAQQQQEQAVVLLNKAFLIADKSLKQTIRPLLYNSALALRKSGKPMPALNAIAILADQERALFGELFLAGTLNLDLGAHRVAYAYLERAVTLQPNDQSANQNLLAAELGAFNEWIIVAKKSLQAEKLEEADNALRKAVNLQPQNTRTSLLRNQINRARQAKASVYFINAQTALDAGDFTSAFEQVKAGLTTQPDNEDGHLLRDEINAALTVDLDRILTEADQALQSKNWDKATEAYAQILAISPQHPEALASREQITNARHQQSLSLLAEGQKALNAGQADRAINAFNQLLALEPNHKRALEGLSTANQMRANRLNEFLLKGRQAMGRNHFKEARQWFNKALPVDDSSRAEQELASLEQLIRQKADKLAVQASQAVNDGKYPQANKLYLQSLALNPEHPLAKSGRKNLAVRIDTAITSKLQKASSALKQNDYTQAITAYRTVLDIAPDNREALEGLNKGREKQASELNNLVKLGQAAFGNGDLARAEQHLAKALQLDAYHKEAQKLRQRLEQARQTGAKPGDEQKLYLQGITYYTQGKYAKAIKSWERVLLLNPGHEKSSQNITKTKRKMRQIEEYRGS